MNYIIAYLAVITWAAHAYSNVFFMLATYLALRGFQSEHAGILIGAFYAATTLARPLGGWITERAGIRRTLICSSLCCLAAALLKFAAVSFAPLLVIRVIMGCSWGVFIVALTTYQSLVVPEAVRGKAFVVISIGSLSCLFTVVPLAEWFLSHNSPRLFLFIPVCTSVLCTALSLRLPPMGTVPMAAAAPSAPAAWGTWRELYRDAPFWRIAVSCAMFGLCDASIVYLPDLIHSKGLTPSSFVIANGLGALAVRFMGRNFFNRHPRYFFAGPSLLLMAVFLYLASMAASNLWLSVCGLFYGAGMGYGYPAHQALTGDLAPAPLRAKASSLVYFCNDATWFVLPLYVGFMTPHTGQADAFKFLSLFCAAAGIALTIMWQTYSKTIKGFSRG